MANTKKVALVTGSGRGIGLGMCRELAKSGFDLVVNDIHPTDVVAPALAELQSLGAAVLYCQSDISKVTEHAGMLAKIKQHYGRLDVLVNNAGVAPNVRADVLEASPESFDRLISINLRGPYFLTQAVAKWMIEQKLTRGCIINSSSVSSTVASVNRGDYCISKAGISMATMLWAARLAEFGIDVYEVRPGIIASDMTAGVKAKYDALIANGLTLEKRWGTPEDVGRAVATLARGDISYATGQVIMIDGGMTLQRL